MTLRQVLDVLWQRRLLVVATLVLVMLAAGAYMRYSVKTYSATAVVRLNAMATASSDTDSAYAGIQLDSDIDTVTSEEVIEPAARELGEPDSTAVGNAIKVELVEGVRTNRIDISATGNSAIQAQQRANAVASAYVGYLSGQVNTGVKALKGRQTASAKRIRQLQAEINRSNNGDNGTDSDNNGDDENADRVLQTYLEAETATLGQIRSQLDAIAAAGKPAIVLLQAKPGKATSISSATILGIGLLSGLLAGAGVALIREQFDQRLHSPGDVEEATGEPILAEVAVVRGRRNNDMSLPTALHGATAFNESIRRLRTSLQVLTPQQSAIVVTSPDPGDGKSFITANLAVSLSLAGRSVIVVGGDLRRAQLGTYFGVTADVRGFADAIEADVDDRELLSMLRPTEHSRLMVLAAGQSKSEPADLLATNTLGNVVQRLRTMADVVLIDTPPALALADAAIIARHADGVVVLSTIGRSQRESLVGTLRVLRANGTHVLGVVCNRSRRSMPDTYREYLMPVASWELPGRSQQSAPQLEAENLSIAGGGSGAATNPAGPAPVGGERTSDRRVTEPTRDQPPRPREATSHRRPVEDDAIGRVAGRPGSTSEMASDINQTEASIQSSTYDSMLAAMRAQRSSGQLDEALTPNGAPESGIAEPGAYAPMRTTTSSPPDDEVEPNGSSVRAAVDKVSVPGEDLETEEHPTVVVDDRGQPDRGVADEDPETERHPVVVVDDRGQPDRGVSVADEDLETERHPVVAVDDQRQHGREEATTNGPVAESSANGHGSVAIEDAPRRDEERVASSS